MRILVSACLLGLRCRYDGASKPHPGVIALAENHELIPVCPERLAGLGIPREPIEIVDGIVRRKDGTSVDEVLRNAVNEIITQLEGQDIECVIMKSRSPTCGVKQVYDGTFSGKLVDGMGVLAAALQEKGYKVIDSEDCRCK